MIDTIKHRSFFALFFLFRLMQTLLEQHNKAKLKVVKMRVLLEAMLSPLPRSSSSSCTHWRRDRPLCCERSSGSVLHVAEGDEEVIPQPWLQRD